MKKFFIILALLFGMSAVPARAQVLTRKPSPLPPFALTYGDKSFPVSSSTLENWQHSTVVADSNLVASLEFSPQNLLSQYLGSPVNTSSQTGQTYRYQPALVYSFIRGLANQIDVPAIEPRLVIEDGRAASFAPPQDGMMVDAYTSTFQALAALDAGATSSPLSVNTSTPHTLLADTNNLGITELIARGESNFKGSPSNRRHNIKVGVQKMTGVIIAPGQEFSFNKYLGPVDGEHDFLPELVIKKSGTVPEFGGGLCQVSSTTFRAAMQAGLPITQRRNHAYAVSYYAPQGTDATIYPGVVDLKFVNDTPGSILVWPYLKDTNTLVFDFYGTKDSRQVNLEKPKQWDRKADGSMKASWTRVVIKDGTAATSTFNSVYLPPALFHKEEGFASSTQAAATQTSNPTTPPTATPQTNTQTIKAN